MSISMKQAAMYVPIRFVQGVHSVLIVMGGDRQDEVQTLQDAVDRISAEKRDVEMQAAEQAETMAQLTDANNTLSARTLSLAEEAASCKNLEKNIEY